MEDNKPDFKQSAIAYTNDGTWGYPVEGDEPGEMMFIEISRAHQEGCEHVWSTHVVPLQEDNKQLVSDQDILAHDLKNTLEREEALIESVNELESEIKALRDSLSSSERFRAEDAASHINEANALREELGTTEKALQEINNQHQEDYKRLKSALEEIERLKAERLTLIKELQKPCPDCACG